VKTIHPRFWDVRFTPQKRTFVPAVRMYKKLEKERPLCGTSWKNRFVDLYQCSLQQRSNSRILM
jgi:hypothetical protein